LENTQISLQYGIPGINSETWGSFCDDLGSNIVVQYSVGLVITVHCRITAKEYVDRLSKQVHRTIHTLFPYNDAVSQDDNAHIYTAGTVQTWFEDHASELRHFPWSA
jgi:hypothetical protein